MDSAAIYIPPALFPLSLAGGRRRPGFATPTPAARVPDGGHVLARLGGRRGTRLAADARSTQAFQSQGGIRMGRFFEVELTVRDYELDQFGVVSHAVYACYCQHGRDEFLKKLGLSLGAIARTGESLALSDLSLKFIAPLRSDDRFVVKVRVLGSSPARIKFEHFIFKLPNQEPILEEVATGVWLGKTYRPIRIPAEVFSRILQFDAYEEPDSIMTLVHKETC